MVTIKCMSFVSRPDLLVPRLDFRIKELGHSTDDYFLFSTWGGACQNAPYIYDEDGHLVWSGYTANSADLGYFDFKPHILSNGSQILSVFHGRSESGCGKGRIALLDDSYQTRSSISSDAREVSLDFHEFQILDGSEKAIIIKGEAVQGDLSSFGISQGLAWVRDCIVQEIHLQSRDVLFEWRATDHVPVSESSVFPDKFGSGLSSFKPFDYFHINSVDKFPNGDYLVSARHTDCVYRVSAYDGSIVWRLGGKNSSFMLADFNFSAQHDARIGKSTREKLRISLFNNGWNGVNQTRNISSAMFLELDESSSPMMPRLIEEQEPYHGGLARHQGSIQSLPNGNRFVSWGEIAEFSEFTAGGDRVLDVAFADTETLVYRTAKSRWKGWPHSNPDLYVYALNESNPSHFYMSWNGATEVSSWNVYGAEAEGGERTILEKVDKRGFETHFEARMYVAAGLVEGLDKWGHVLGQSAVQSAVTPPMALRSACGRSHCTMQQVQFSDPDVAVPEPQPFRSPGEDMLWFNILLEGLIMAVAGYILGRFSRRYSGRRIPM